MKVIRIDILRVTSERRRTGYFDAVIAAGRVEGEYVLIPDNVYEVLRIRWGGGRPPEPSLVGKVAGFAGAMARWVKAGAPLVTEAEYERRLEICAACPEWGGAAYGGLGKCRICRCAGVKLRLATEKCPLGKWPATHMQPPCNPDSGP